MIIFFFRQLQVYDGPQSVSITAVKKSRCNSSTSCDRVDLATEAKYRTERRLKTDIFMHFRVASKHYFIKVYLKSMSG